MDKLATKIGIEPSFRMAAIERVLQAADRHHSLLHA